MPRGRKNYELKSVIYRGVYYSRKADKRYYRAMRWDADLKKSWEDSLHRAVWRHHNGPIPKGLDVHHKDNDPDNNDISNLQLISKSDHAKLHDAFREWNATAEAKVLRDRNRQAALATLASRPLREYSCVRCGAKFLSKHPDPTRLKFCGKLCRSRANEDARRQRRYGPTQ